MSGGGGDLDGVVVAGAVVSLGAVSVAVVSGAEGAEIGEVGGAAVSPGGVVVDGVAADDPCRLGRDGLPGEELDGNGDEHFRLHCGGGSCSGEPGGDEVGAGLVAGSDPFVLTAIATPGCAALGQIFGSW